MKYSLTERQKEMLCSIAPGLEEGTIFPDCLYLWGNGKIQQILSTGSQYKSIQIQWDDVTESDFADFEREHLLKWTRNSGQGSLMLYSQKIIDAVKNNFGEDDEPVVSSQKVEAVFGEPSSDPDFECDIFLVMPFRPELDNVYSVLKTIATDLNIIIKRGDQFASLQNVVINDVWSAINRCRLIIADCTAIEKTIGDSTYNEINGNVYYEIGIADALHKPVLLLTRNMENIPFDLKHRRFVVYHHAYHLYDTLKPTIVKILKSLK